jgi:hypothetical protein
MTEAIVANTEVSEILKSSGIASVSRMEQLHGIERQVRIFACRDLRFRGATLRPSRISMLKGDPRLSPAAGFSSFSTD